MKNPSVNRKADRKFMADELCRLAQSLGASAKATEDERTIRVEIVHPSGLKAGIDIEPSRLKDTFCIPWNSWQRKLSFNFSPHVNPYHHGKATLFACGFDRLCAEIKRALNLANNGEAFMD